MIECEVKEVAVTVPARRRPMSMESRLREYAEWRNDGPLDVPVGESVFGRIARDQENAGIHGDGIKPEIIDGIACKPDGGLGMLVERMGYDIARDRRCREIHELLPYMPVKHREVMDATYIGLAREVPRAERSAATLLGLSRVQYCARKAAVHAWFEGAMFRSLAV